MLALAHTLYTEKLHDEKFLDAYTVGFKKFLPYLTGETDGEAKTAEWAEEITGVPADTIRELARRMAKGRTMLMSGWAIQRQDHGEQPYWSGDAGRHAGPDRPAGRRLRLRLPLCQRRLADRPARCPRAGIDAGDNPVKASPSRRARLNDMLLNPGSAVDYNGEKVTYPDIRLIYWAGGNPFHHHQDRNKQIGPGRSPKPSSSTSPGGRRRREVRRHRAAGDTTFERNDMVSCSEYSGRFVHGDAAAGRVAARIEERFRHLHRDLRTARLQGQVHRRQDGDAMAGVDL